MIKPFPGFPNPYGGVVKMFKTISTFFITSLLLSACSSVNPMTWFSPHRMVIQQGNYVTEDAVARVKPGMTRSQVRFLLGTPLLNDIFHADRWDYPYRIERQGQPAEEKRLTVFFDKDTVTRVEGNAFPAARPAIDNPPPAGQN